MSSPASLATMTTTRSKLPFTRQRRYYDRNPERYRQWRKDHPGFMMQWYRRKMAEQARLEADASLAMEQLGLSKEQS